MWFYEVLRGKIIMGLKYRAEMPEGISMNNEQIPQILSRVMRYDGLQLQNDVNTNNAFTRNILSWPFCSLKRGVFLFAATIVKK